jgi:hypothetical protein
MEPLAPGEPNRTSRSENQVVSLVAGRLNAEVFEAAGVPVTRSIQPARPQPPIILSNARLPQEWERLIHSAWQKETDRILEVAKLVLQARTQLLPEVFAALRLPFKTRVAQMLAKIAVNPVLTDPANHGSLPPCWRTLYELTKLSHAELKSAIEAGAVHSRMQRKDVDSLRGRQGQRRSGNDKDSGESPPDPRELRRQLKAIGWERFRQEVMPPDWCKPLVEMAIALATPEHLIEALERKCSPFAALKNLKKS